MEILFHPGRASHEERGFWQRKNLTDFYLSAERDRDAARVDHARKRLLNSPKLSPWRLEHDKDPKYRRSSL